ncbi:MAG: FAD-binding protein, partial [Halobacteria archaeon]|nr:FAD-binding protein [Halobacteria archaeon]
MEESEKFDVAVVGGGPGGSTAAAEAAKEGDLNVVVFEKGTQRNERDGLGPDSTDAAGILDYWLPIMEIGPDEYQELPVMQEIDYAEFLGPNEKVTFTETGLDSWYDKFAFTFDRVAMDDLLR